MRATTAPTSGVRHRQTPPWKVYEILILLYLLPSAAFLSCLRLSAYMAVVAVAIVLSFHLKVSSRPTPLELRMAKPLGAVFWTLSVLSLASGLANYIRE